MHDTLTEPVSQPCHLCEMRLIELEHIRQVNALQNSSIIELQSQINSVEACFKRLHDQGWTVRDVAQAMRAMHFMQETNGIHTFDQWLELVKRVDTGGMLEKGGF